MRTGLIYLIIGLIFLLGLIFAPLMGYERIEIIHFYSTLEVIIGFILIGFGLIIKDLSYAFIGGLTALLALNPMFDWPVFNFVVSILSGMLGVGTMIQGFYREIFY
ncbi:MAG: hypothetical protein K9G67_06315 [Bacteroidales bacterium]|nr:hypothetical protein [Bacteroidales bacterium]MCF8343539.1 hypothetical protein [Bacteroidales bacterium]MCF8349830.1 hypothetical protein [Bacteroidales bacterium]MCF8375951.1 hypothetical protein [Bacteroidales bacterium]